jgi:hydroxyethylthiazole kinase
MPGLFSLTEVWSALEDLRARRPLIHNITNYVAMNASANVLLALGAAPAMAHALQEVEDFVAVADALVINIGTPSLPWVTAMQKAAARAGANGKPWVLDPLGCGATPYRMQSAVTLSALSPDIICGNAAEIMSLAGEAGIGRGAASLDNTDEAIKPAAALAARTGAVVAVTGAVDYVTGGGTPVAVHAGHTLMRLSTSLGSSLSAVIAAFTTVRPPREATLAGLAVFGAAGSAAAARCRGPGHLQAEICDELYLMTPDSLARHASIAVG